MNRSILKTRLLFLVMLLVVVALPVVVILLSHWWQNSYGLPVNQSHSLSFEWQDVDGQQHKFEGVRPGYTLLFLGYLQCRDYCPMKLHQLQQIAGLLTAMPMNKTEILFLSIDQQHDDPQILASWASQYPILQAGYINTNSLGVVSRQLQERVNVSKDNIRHRSSLYLLNHEGRLIKVYGQQQLSPEKVVDDILQTINTL